MRYLPVLLASLALIPVAWSRDLPDEAILAELAARDYPFVQLAGKQARLAPGALIYDEQSRIIPPNTLPAKARALYRLDNRGEVQTIWLLTTDETAQLKDKKKSP